MKAISDEVGFSGKDIFKQIFLFVQGQNDIEKDFEIILGVIRSYFKEKHKPEYFGMTHMPNCELTAMYYKKQFIV